MKLPKMLVLVIIALCVGIEGRAQSLIGLFDLEEGARPAAMGGAFVALAEDEHAIFYNPAGLAFLKEMHLSGLFESRFARANYGTIAFALPHVGAQFFLLGIGGLIQRDEIGAPQDELPYSQVGFLLGGGASLAEPPVDLGLPLAAGLQIKIYRVNTLPGGSGTTFSLTPSLLFSEERLLLAGFPIQSVRVGLILPDLLSPGIAYGSGHHESWGPGLRLGGALTLPEGLALALDLEADGTLHLGGEWQLRGLELGEGLGTAELALRLGLRNLRSVLSPSLGFGVRVGDFRIDYAFALHPVLPGNHRISFSAVFGPPNVLLCALRPEVCPPDDPLHLR